MEQSIKSVLVKQSLAQQQPINNLQVPVDNLDGFWKNLLVESACSFGDLAVNMINTTILCILREPFEKHLEILNHMNHCKSLTLLQIPNSLQMASLTMAGFGDSLSPLQSVSNSK